MSDNRQLDIAVARLLGPNVLGEAPATENHTNIESWSVRPGAARTQPVYLAHCFCSDQLDDEAMILGHVASCLEVVPFYHLDAALAVAALEQVCDERGLVADPYRAPGGTWVVELIKPPRSGVPVNLGEDKSFPLAVVKALVELERIND